MLELSIVLAIGMLLERRLRLMLFREADSLERVKCYGALPKSPG